MVVAISNRQWRELIQGVGLEAALTTAADALGYSLDDEGGRFEARELISAFLRPWFARRSINEIRKALSGRSVLWSPYRSFKQMLAEDPRCSIANPMFAVVDNPKWGSWMTAGSPLAFSNAQRQSAGVAPTLGMDTQSVLDDLAPSTPSPGMTAAQPGHVKGLS